MHQDEKKIETFERNFHVKQRAVYKKNRKPVIWNGLEFESQNALGRHLKLTTPAMVASYLKKKMKLKGHLVEFKKENENE